MSHLLIPFRVLYKIYYLLYFLFSFILFYPLLWFFLSLKKFNTGFNILHFYALLWQYCALAPVRIKGNPSLQNGPYIICCNHSSYMDIPGVYAVFKDYFVNAGKKELANWPMFKILYTSGMNISVDRHNEGGSTMAIKKMMKTLDKGNSIALFPEGTISPDAPQMIDFKPGVFSLAISKQVPVLPVTFVSNWKRLQRKKFWMGHTGPGFADVVIHKPITTIGLAKKDVNVLMRKVKETINKPLQERWGELNDTL